MPPAAVSRAELGFSRSAYAHFAHLLYHAQHVVLTVHNMLDVLVIDTANLCHFLQDTRTAYVTF